MRRTWIHFLHINPHTTNNSSGEVLTLEPSQWPVYVINSVDKSKLPCYILPPTQYHSFFRNLPPLFIQLTCWTNKLAIRSFASSPLTNHAQCFWHWLLNLAIAVCSTRKINFQLKVVRDGFLSLFSTLSSWSRKLAPFVKSTNSKLKPIANLQVTFPPLKRLYRVFTLGSHWFFVIFPFLRLANGENLV